MAGDGIPLEEFIEETMELLSDMEGSILELETRPEDRIVIDALFRGMHTIKGGAGIVKQSGLAHYAHNLETLLDQARAGQIQHSDKLGSVLLESIDCIRGYVSSIEQGLQADHARIEASLEDIQPLLHTPSGEPEELTSLSASDPQLPEIGRAHV